MPYKNKLNQTMHHLGSFTFYNRMRFIFFAANYKTVVMSRPDTDSKQFKETSKFVSLNSEIAATCSFVNLEVEKIISNLSKFV